MVKGRRSRMGRAAGWIALVLATGVVSAAAQNVPPVVVSTTTTMNTSGTSSVGKVVQDTCGDVYDLEGNGNLLEIPAGGGAAQTISLPPNGLAGGTHGLAIDSDNTLYVGGMDGYYSGGHLWKIPSSNCVPQVSSATNLYSDIGSLGAISYYSAPNGVTVDPQGDVFLSTGTSCCTTTPNWIIEITPSGTVAEVVSNYASQITSMAADSNGDVFFTASGSGDVYEVPAGSYSSSSAGTPTAVISSGLQTAMGLAFDSAGNLYVGDSGTGSIYEVPLTTSGSTTPALQFSSMYLLASGAPLGAPFTLATDGRSFLFGNNNANVYHLALGTANLGEVATSSSATATIDVAFNAGVTLSSLSLFPSSGQYSMSGGGAACSTGTSYTARQSCSENITFSPVYPGMARAGFTISGSTGSALATLYLSGTGMGAGITLDPGVVSATGGGFQSPEGVAIDAAGDTFYADSSSNAVLEFAPGSSTPTDLGTGLSQPAGVAVDGAGNVLIADTGNNRIVEVPRVNGALSNSAQIALATTLAGEALQGPAGIAIDNAGDLFIADTGNNRIVAVPYNGSWNFSAATSVGSSLNGPMAVAPDLAGNLFVADSGAGQIYKILNPLTQPSQQLVAVGFGKPSGLAVDASGSLFVADSVNGEVARIPNVSGNLDSNLTVQAGIGINAPYGVAVDPAGNLYVSDSSAGAAYEVARTSVTLDFGNWALGATSGPFSAEVENEGNQPLTLGNPWYGSTGNTGDFSISATASGGCAAGGSVAVGDSCALNATFTPTVAGARSAVLTLTSNAANASPQQVTLTGGGGTATSTTTILAISSPASGSPFFGQPINFTITVTAANGTPTGSILLLVDGVQTGTARLSSSGAATFDLAAGLAGGVHSAIAIYNGTSAFSGSVSQVLQISVTKAPTVTALTVDSPFTNPPNALAGSSVALTAAIQSTGVGIPTGMVTFTSNGTSLGTGSVLPVSGGNFEATISTTALTAGSNSITAAYSGDANYIASTSTATTLTVVTSPQVTISSSGTSITSGTGGNSTINFTAASYGGWNGLIGFTCLASSLPANTRCVFSPGQIQVMSSTATAQVQNLPVTLSIATNQPPQTPTASGFLWWFAFPTGLLLFFMRRRFARRIWTTVALIAAVLLLGLSGLGLSACGGNTPNLTPSGASTITVYAWADPFTAAPSTSSATPPTEACPANNPATAPCSQQAFQIALTVK